MPFSALNGTRLALSRGSRSTPMLNSPTANSLSPRDAGHYCPVCLRCVRADQGVRRAHRETCRSGDLELSLVLCPTCGLTLAADAPERQAGSLDALHS